MREIKKGTFIDKSIDLSKLPRRGKYIDWKNSIGVKLGFKYEDVIGEIEIIDYKKEDHMVKVKYDEFKYQYINTDSLVKCSIGAVLTNGFGYIYNIGQNIKDEFRDLVILDSRKIKDINERDWKVYKIKCNKCGFESGEHYRNGEYSSEYYIREYSLKYGSGCPCCSGRVTVPTINSIKIKYPDYKSIGISNEDAYRYTNNSHNIVSVNCPNCDSKKEVMISRLFTQGIGCLICSDGISYPEKIINSLLQTLGISAKREHSPKWERMNGRRYDFYLGEYDIIIETHGIQHYKDAFSLIGGRSLQQEQENDKIKKQLALDNGIKEENYIIIDCRKSDLEFIKQNILNSRLNELFDLSNINWDKINKDCQKNIMIEVCKYWKNKKEDETTSDLATIFQANKKTIRNYLLKGNELKWCNYIETHDTRHKRKVEVFKDGNSKGVFESYAYLERNSERLFGVKFLCDKVGEVCNGKRKKYKGFTFIGI